MKKEVKILLGLATAVAGVFIVKRLKDVKSCDVEDLESDSSNADMQELDEDDSYYDIEEDLGFSSCESDSEEDLDFSSCEYDSIEGLDEDDSYRDIIEEDLDFSSCESDGNEECVIEDNFAQVCGVTREFAIDEIVSKNDDYSYDTLTDLSDSSLAEVYAKTMGY